MVRSALTGTRVRERRQRIGLKQADLARAVGVSPAYLNLIEHNRRRVGADLLVSLANALGVGEAALAEGADSALSRGCAKPLRAPPAPRRARPRVRQKPTGSRNSSAAFRAGRPCWPSGRRVSVRSSAPSRR